MWSGGLQPAESSRRAKARRSTGHEEPQPRATASRFAHDFSAIPVSRAGDAREQQADAVASRVMSMAGAPPFAAQQSAGASGHALDAATRAFMEPRFGRDFSGVRVHFDSDADASAREIHAAAYTIGNDIVFARGQYAPHTSSGRRLIAHELAHTIQQSAPGSAPIVQRQPAPDAGPRIPEPIRTLPPKEERGPTTTRVAPPPPAPAAKPCTDVALPCKPKGITIAELLKANPPEGALGVTTIAAGARAPLPEVRTKRSGRGVVIEKTTTKPVPCTSVYATAGRFSRKVSIDPALPGHKDLAEKCGTTYIGKFRLLADGVKRVEAAELEHCTDYKYAFDTSLGCYAAIVNELARKKTRFATYADAVDAVAKRAGRKPDDWGAHYMSLIDKSALRDTRRWHTAIAQGPTFVQMNRGRCEDQSEMEINGKSYPHVGRHSTPDLIQ